MIAQIERSAHDAAWVNSDAPTASAGNLGDQSVSVKASKDAADFRAGFFGILGTVPPMRGRGKPLADISIGEPTQAVIAIHDALE